MGETRRLTPGASVTSCCVRACACVCVPACVCVHVRARAQRGCLKSCFSRPRRSESPWRGSGCEATSVPGFRARPGGPPCRPAGTPPPNRRPRSRRPGVTPQRPARRLAPSVPGRPGRRPLPSGSGVAAGLRGLAARERHRANAAEKFACQQTLPENARSQLTTPAFRGSESSRWSILAQEGGPPNAPGPPRPPLPSTYCGRGGRGVSLLWRPVLRYKGAEMQTALESCLKNGPANFLPSEFWGGFKFIQANDPRFEEHFADGGLSPESKTNDWDTPTAWGAGAPTQESAPCRKRTSFHWFRISSIYWLRDLERGA